MGQRLLLPASVVTLVVLSTLLLGMSQNLGAHLFFYPAVAVAAGGLSLWLTDATARVQIHRSAAGLLALLVWLWTIIQIVRDTEQSLLYVANSLVLLASILLFQRKSDRVYWQLLVLSLLQVVVGSALNAGLVFGIFLFVYLVFALFTLAFFFAAREARPFQRGADVPPPRHFAPGAGERCFPVPLADDAARRVLSRSFLTRLGQVVVLTLLGTVALFFAIPRYSNTVWESPADGRVVTVGFTEDVALDDIGRILENPEVVMNVQFFDHLSRRSYTIHGEPYFHGAILSRYEGNGRWRQLRRSGDRRHLGTAPDLVGLVEQWTLLFPGSHNVAFHCAPSYAVPQTGRAVLFQPLLNQLTFDDPKHDARSSYQYILGTSAFRDGWQREVIPATVPISSTASSELVDFDESDLPTIRQLAEQILTRENLQQAGVYAKAKALERHFTNSDLYKFSLDVNTARDRTLDPIEDFVRNHRTGHCEYFASALALMLRSQRIPARIVIGYKGGEFNSVGSFYRVRQLHAHAWVEVYLAPDEVPAQFLLAGESPAPGAWLRLDPTPADSSDLALLKQGGVLKILRDVFDYGQVLWDNYVLGLNVRRQYQAVYGPLLHSAKAAGQFLVDGQRWKQRVESLWQFLRDPLGHRGTGWQLALIGAACTAGVWLARRPLGRLAKSFVPRRARNRRRASGRRSFELFPRLEAILHQLGFRRAPGETPLEFALAAGGQLAEKPALIHLAGVPRRIVEAFYRVRFGDQTLADHETNQLAEALKQLEKEARLTLEPSRRRRRPRAGSRPDPTA